MLTIEPPPRSIIAGATDLMPRNTPIWLTSRIRRYVSRSVSRSLPRWKIPALLTRTSTWPWSSTVRPTTSAQASSERTSWATKVAPISLASTSPSACSTSVTTTSAPSSRNSVASAPPCPRAPPVTIATLPSSLPMTPPLLGAGPYRTAGPADGSGTKRHEPVDAPAVGMIQLLGAAAHESIWPGVRATVPRSVVGSGHAPHRAVRSHRPHVDPRDLRRRRARRHEPGARRRHARRRRRLGHRPHRHRRLLRRVRGPPAAVVGGPP